jgi:hypothetical protein
MRCGVTSEPASPQRAAIALANKLARIAWVVLHKGCAFEGIKTNEAA